MVYSITFPTISGLDSAVAWIITRFGAIWLGVIIFTLLLKTLTLPLDYFSRSSMRKMSVKMERLRPELEKLQAQYANDKEKYNQKMMALYKKENIGLMSSCLPTIVTLVVFIIVLSSFNSYSTYQNKMDYCNMTFAYNNAIYAGIEYDDSVAVLNTDNDELANYKVLTFKDNEIYNLAAPTTYPTLYQKPLTNGVTFFADYKTPTIIDATKSKVDVYYYSQNSYAVVKTSFVVNVDGTVEFSKNYEYDIRLQGLMEFDAYGNPVVDGEGKITNKLISLASDKNNNLKNHEGKTFAEFVTALNTTDYYTAGKTFITNIQQLQAKVTYNAEKESFFWVKNIWQADSALQKEIPSTWATEAGYEQITGLMIEEKETVNGYFILIVLTIVFSILQQLVMTKSQKAQMELQSANGQGATTQKIMLWMMPIMMGVFSLFWTSALAIYIIISSIFAIITTFLINKLVDISIAKEDAKKQSATSNRSTRRTKVVKKEEPKKESKKSKKNQIPKNDFLSDSNTTKKEELEEKYSTLTEEEMAKLEAKRKQSMSKKKAKQLKDKNNKK